MRRMDIYLVPAAVALIVAIISTYTDIRSRIIPNRLTYSAAAFGILFHLLLGIYSSNVFVCVRGLIGFCLAFTIGYILWMMGGWAGGDVKLFAAFGALLPSFYPPFAPAPYSSEYPLFVLTVFLNTALVGLPIILLYTAICFVRGEGAFHKQLRVSDLKEGMVPAEWIYEINGKICRKNALLPLRIKCDISYTEPNRASGLTKPQIVRLKKLVKEGKIKNRIRIKRTIPFGPFLAAGLTVSVLYGDLYWKIITLL